MIQNNPVIQLPLLNLYGLLMQFVSSKEFTISSGQCRDSTDTIDLVVGNPTLAGVTTPAPITINITINGVNGLDHGSILPNRLYKVAIIGDSRYNNPVAANISLANTNDISLPYGYDSYRIIGFIRTDASSDIIPFVCSGLSNTKTLFYQNISLIALLSGSSTTQADIDFSEMIPYLPENLGKVYMLTQYNTSSVPSFYALYTAGSSTQTHTGNSQVNGISKYEQVSMVPTPSNASSFSNPIIKYTVFNPADTLTVICVGFEFNV